MLFQNSEQDEFDLDDRMTEETKKFVVSNLKIIRPSQVPKIDIKISRQARAANTAKIVAGLKFDNLKAREAKVKNQNDDHEIPLSIYVPNDVKRDSPITVFYHGGGWTFGSRDSHYHAVATCATLSNTIWISVEYRLGPEHKFLTQISDCVSALQWVIDNKAEIGSSNAKIGVSGDSAGGHYAAIMAHEFKSALSYQILIYPCVDLITVYDTYAKYSKECYILTPDLINFFTKNLVDEKDLNMPRASPLFYNDFNALPKCLMLCAELDPLIGHSIAYEKKLKENSNDCTLHTINGTIHGFFHNGVFLKDAFEQGLKHVLEFLETV